MTNRALCYSVILVAFSILGACATDPTAPRHRKAYVAMNGQVPDMPLNIAKPTCEARAQSAFVQAEQEFERENARMETVCETTRRGSSDEFKTVCREVNRAGSLHYGAEMSRAGWEAKRLEMTVCMAEYGYIERTVCVANCSPLPPEHTGEKPWLGIRVQELTLDMAQALGSDVKEGVIIAEVYTDSLAAESGLRRGDIIVRVNGEAVKSFEVSREILGQMETNSKNYISVYRGGRLITLEVVRR